jgi:hypothetical protein
VIFLYATILTSVPFPSLVDTGVSRFSTASNVSTNHKALPHSEATKSRTSQVSYACPTSDGAGRYSVSPRGATR